MLLMLYFIVVMYFFLLYVYLYNWAAYLGQDTPGKEIFNLSEVLSWLNKGKKNKHENYTECRPAACTTAFRQDQHR